MCVEPPRTEVKSCNVVKECKSEDGAQTPKKQTVSAHGKENLEESARHQEKDC